MPYVRNWATTGPDKCNTTFRDVRFIIEKNKDGSHYDLSAIYQASKATYSNDYVALESLDAAKTKAEDFAIKTYYLPALPPIGPVQDRMTAIAEWRKAEKVWATYLSKRVNCVKPDLQLFLDHPGYIWIPMDTFSNVVAAPTVPTPGVI